MINKAMPVRGKFQGLKLELNGEASLLLFDIINTFGVVDSDLLESFVENLDDETREIFEIDHSSDLLGAIRDIGSLVSWNSLLEDVKDARS